MKTFKIRYRIYWVETDALGVMHFSNYFRLCERTEEDFINSLGLSFDKKPDISFPRVKATCEYKSPLRFNDWVSVELSLKEIGKKHLTYVVEMINETTNKQCAKCEITVASISKNFESVPVPEEYLKILNAYLKK